MTRDLEILEKYLSKDELKKIAREAALAEFKNTLNKTNKYHKENYDFYLKWGSLEAIREYISDYDKEELARQLQTKTSQLIKKLDTYDLPNNYKTIAEEHIEANKDIIIKKVDSLLTEFVNNQNFPSAHTSFQDIIGESFSDILYSMLENRFKNEK